MKKIFTLNRVITFIQIIMIGVLIFMGYNFYNFKKKAGEQRHAVNPQKFITSEYKKAYDEKREAESIKNNSADPFFDPSKSTVVTFYTGDDKPLNNPGSNYTRGTLPGTPSDPEGGIVIDPSDITISGNIVSAAPMPSDSEDAVNNPVINNSVAFDINGNPIPSSGSEKTFPGNPLTPEDTVPLNYEGNLPAGDYTIDAERAPIPDTIFSQVGSMLLMADEEEENFDIEKVPAIGTMEIPAISMTENIYLGTSASVLKYSLGLIEKTDIPSKKPGNFSIIAGHRGYTGISRYLLYADRLKNGDDIYVNTAEGKLHYKVTASFTMLPDEMGNLYPSEGQSVLYLVTCTPLYKWTHRLIIEAKLIS